MSRPSLEAIAQYGGAVLLELTPAEQELGSPVRNAALALDRYRKAAADFAATKDAINTNRRFSDQGRQAELADFAARTLNEVGRHDALLARAQVERDQLAEEARQVPLNLSAEQLSLLPATLAMIREIDPLMQPLLLAEAAAGRDALVVGAFLNAPHTGLLKLAITDEQVDQAREVFAGARADRTVLKRMRELVGAAETARRALLDELRTAAGLGPDDPVARMAVGEAA